MFSSRKRASLINIPFTFGCLVIGMSLFYFHSSFYTQVMSLRIRCFDVFSSMHHYVVAWKGASKDVKRLYLQNLKLESDLAKLKSFQSISSMLAEENTQLRALVGSHARMLPKFAAKPKIIHQRHKYHHMILPSSSARINEGSLVREGNHVVGLVEILLFHQLLKLSYIFHFLVLEF